jgi:hypothetical protein
MVSDLHSWARLDTMASVQLRRRQAAILVEAEVEAAEHIVGDAVVDTTNALRWGGPSRAPLPCGRTSSHKGAPRGGARVGHYKNSRRRRKSPAASTFRNRTRGNGEIWTG